MSQPVLLKVYGSIHPAEESLSNALSQIAANAIPYDGHIITVYKDIIGISFEGIYFPVDETLSTIKKYLHGNETGRLDILNLEEWKLQRHKIANGHISGQSVPLNNVLAAAGH